MAKRLNASLTVRFALLLLAVLLVAIGIYSFSSIVTQRQVGEQKVLEEARLLNQQMTATWDYVDSVQSRINLNADGSYSFKGVYCSVAGKNIAQRFTSKTDCTIRYVRENPRSANDVPDEFELEALRAFERGEHEYYAVTDHEGRSVFRYLSSIPIVFGCLTCHGEPEGTYDETGFRREGMRLGDVAGAVSIMIPMEQYEAEIADRTMSEILLFVSLAALILVCTSFAINHWVISPLRQLGTAAQQIGAGNFDTEVGEVPSPGEIAVLSKELASMERSLRDFYGMLETQVKERTVELREANELLERHRDEIAQVNERLVAANRALREENDYKSTFLATMSHELRTPLSSTISYVNVLLRLRGLDPDARHMLSEIKRNSKDLLLSVDNILDAARLEAKRFSVSPEPVDLVDVASMAESVIAPLAQEKGVLFAMRVDPEVPLIRIDPEVLRKVLLNLLGNAVKFTEGGGSVEAALEVHAEDRRLLVTVADTGIGISADDLERVFERFKQVDSSLSRSYGGSGLGLSLVKEMVDLLGGSVQVKSSPGSGSVFTVEIPYEGVGGGDADEGFGGR